MTRLCACGCGASLDHRHPTARFASDACRARGWKTRTGYVRQTLAEAGSDDLQEMRERNRRRRGGEGRRHRYEVDPLTGCWVWYGSRTAAGYGTFVETPPRRGVYAHRYQYELRHGPIPAGLVIDHLCRNPSCCNPDHLEPVTQATNIQRGRVAHLSLTQVEEIRAALRNGARQCDLADEYGVARSTVSRLARGFLWRVREERLAAAPEPAPASSTLFDLSEHRARPVSAIGGGDAA